MVRKKTRSEALADPEKLPPVGDDEKLQVIIETPQGKPEQVRLSTTSKKSSP